jgi:hypothetical protein
MNSESVILFYAGMVVQAVFLPFGQLSWKDAGTFLICCGVSLAGFIPGKHEHNYDLRLHLFLAACLFAIIYAVCFKKKILERINREILMVWTLVGLYVVVETPFIVANPYLSFPLMVLSLIAVINAFASFDEQYGWKVYFYIWFLCILIGILASQFAFSTMSAVFGFGHNTGPPNPIMAFVIGMSFLYLAVNVWYVLELIPLPGKHQTFGERLEQVEEDLEILAEDYDVEQVRRWKTLLLLIFCVSLLAVNYVRHVVSDTTLIPLLIAIVPVLHKMNFSKPPAASVNPPTEA